MWETYYLGDFNFMETAELAAIEYVKHNEEQGVIFSNVQLLEKIKDIK